MYPTGARKNDGPRTPLSGTDKNKTAPPEGGAVVYRELRDSLERDAEAQRDRAHGTAIHRDTLPVSLDERPEARQVEVDAGTEVVAKLVLARRTAVGTVIGRALHMVHADATRDVGADDGRGQLIDRIGDPSERAPVTSDVDALVLQAEVLILQLGAELQRHRGQVEPHHPRHVIARVHHVGKDRKSVV